METPSIKIFLNLNDSKKNQGNTVSTASTTRPSLRSNATANDRPNPRPNTSSNDRPNIANDKRPSTAQSRSEDRFKVNVNRKIKIAKPVKLLTPVDLLNKGAKTNLSGAGTSGGKKPVGSGMSGGSRLVIPRPIGS